VGNERTVTIAGVKEDQAGSLLTEHTGIAGVKDAALDFKKINSYTTFSAEWTMNGEDMVFHFFMPKDYRVTEHYWLEVFAKALDAVAQRHFDATAPRLMAKYTEEVKSWWFKAQGYDHIIDKDVYVDKFLERLDAELDGNFKVMSQRKTR
jgi:hypothetical protein